MSEIKKFLDEKRLVGRWLILVVGLTGAFAGALLMFLMALLGIVIV